MILNLKAVFCMNPSSPFFEIRGFCGGRDEFWLILAFSGVEVGVNGNIFKNSQTK